MKINLFYSSELSISKPVVYPPSGKKKPRKQLQNQINQLDGRLQQLGMQGQRAMSELQKQAESQPDNPGIKQQIGDVQTRLKSG